MCSSLLSERLTSSDVLGVSWGRTLHALAGVVGPLPACEVVQMVGTVPAVDLDLDSMDLVRRFGQATGGAMHALHAPLVVDTPELARALRESDFVRATTRRFPDITCALVGIGSWDRGGSSLRSALPPQVATRAADAGATADMCSTVLDEHGAVLDATRGSPTGASRSRPSSSERSPRHRHRRRRREGRRHRATARAGLVHTLVTDHAAAGSSWTADS